MGSASRGASRARTLAVSQGPGGEPEIFASIQGEGATCGLPSVFLRLATCNLRCTWCDTAYTWDWTRFEPRRSMTRLRPVEAVEHILRLAVTRGSGSAPIRNVVITGGEPMLQQLALVDLASALKAHGFRLEVETNGTIAPAEPLPAAIDQWNVSPKLGSSGNEPAKRDVTDVLTWYGAQPNAYFKFVVVEPADLQEVRAIVARAGVPAARVLLMPEGTDSETVLQRSRWLADECRTLGYRLSTRLHILLWGNERGR